VVASLSAAVSATASRAAPQSRQDAGCGTEGATGRSDRSTCPEVRRHPRAPGSLRRDRLPAAIIQRAEDRFAMPHRSDTPDYNDRRIPRDPSGHRLWPRPAPPSDRRHHDERRPRHAPAAGCPRPTRRSRSPTGRRVKTAVAAMARIATSGCRRPQSVAGRGSWRGRRAGAARRPVAAGRRGRVTSKYAFRADDSSAVMEYPAHHELEADAQTVTTSTRGRLGWRLWGWVNAARVGLPVASQPF
jgi:hypothetical protein